MRSNEERVSGSLFAGRVEGSRAVVQPDVLQYGPLRGPAVIRTLLVTLWTVPIIFGETVGVHSAQRLTARGAWERNDHAALSIAVERLVNRFPQCAGATGDEAETDAGLVGEKKLFIAWTFSSGGSVCVFGEDGRILFRRSGPVEGVLAVDQNADGVAEFVVRTQSRGTGVSNTQRQIYFLQDSRFGVPNTYDEHGYDTNFESIRNSRNAGDRYDPEILTYEAKVDFADTDSDGFRESAILYRTVWWGADDDVLRAENVDQWVSEALKEKYGVGVGERSTSIIERWKWDPAQHRYDQRKSR